MPGKGKGQRRISDLGNRALSMGVDHIWHRLKWEYLNGKYDTLKYDIELGTFYIPIVLMCLLIVTRRQ